jgi:DNA polymerase-1
MATALIDADIVAYRAAAVAQEDIEWNDGNEGLTVNKQQALDAADHILKEWTQGARCKKAVLCFTCAGNFRKEIYPEYKSNRKGEPPELLGDVIQHLKDHHEWYGVPRLEADDVMGIYATSEFVKNAIIVSIDKDMKTLPAMLFNPDKDRAPRRNRLAQADLAWMTQTLTGDSGDGYKGIPGIGPKKAEKILAEAQSMSLMSLWSTVVSAYRDAGMSEDDALVQARLARILRAEDYDKDAQEILLWHPTNPTTMSLTPSTTPVAALSPSTSSSQEASIVSADSAKETFSSTSFDGDENHPTLPPRSKTSKKRSSTSRSSSKPPRKKRTTNSISIPE